MRYFIKVEGFGLGFCLVCFKSEGAFIVSLMFYLLS